MKEKYKGTEGRQTYSSGHRIAVIAAAVATVPDFYVSPIWSWSLVGEPNKNIQ